MHEFESFVFLDVEKTGTGFISALLRRFSKEKELRREHHEPLRQDFDRTKFYFISVRDPLDCYLSLYSYGLDLRGKLRNRLTETHAEAFYNGTMEGFSNWLRFVLKPENAKYLEETYSRTADGALVPLVGLQSFRHLRMAIPNANRRLRKCETRDHIRQVYARHNIVDFVIRKETFHDDLITLLSGPLRHAMTDVDEAVAYVRNGQPVNKSSRVDAEGFALTKPRMLAGMLREREWFLLDQFGYLCPK